MKKKRSNESETIEICKPLSGNTLSKMSVGKVKNVARFVPGNEPSTYYGKQKLNADINWDIVVTKILTKNYTLQTLAKEIGASEKLLQRLLQKDFKNFPFRLGAHLLGIYTVLFGDDAPIT
jgi:hypothetical protein